MRNLQPVRFRRLRLLQQLDSLDEWLATRCGNTPNRDDLRRKAAELRTVVAKLEMPREPQGHAQRTLRYGTLCEETSKSEGKYRDLLECFNRHRGA